MALVLSLLTVLSVASVLTAPPAAAAAGNCTPDAGYTGCASFGYTGALDSFTVPANVTSLKVKTWGAGGGGVDGNFSQVQAGGGGGGYATGVMSVTPGQTLSVVVGQGGRSGTNGSTTAAFGGGGPGGSHTTTGSAISDGGGGGGYSGVANASDFNAASSLMLGGGGGGAGPSTMTGTPDSGGGGGNTGGQSTVPASTGRGGSTTAGGAGATTNTNCTTAGNGSKLTGGAGGSVSGTTTLTPNSGGGGGGGGWFGGGGGRCGKAIDGATLADQAGSGGGGASMIGASGFSSTSTTPGTNGVSGSPGTPGAAGNNSDPQYVAGVGVGGAVTVAGGGNGGNGLVVLEWNLGYTISKSASALTASPGGTLTYRLTITNTSSNAYTSASPAGFSDNLSDVLDDAVYNADAASTVSGWTFSGTSTLTGSGPLAAGQSATITYSVTVQNPDNGNNSLVNVLAPASAAGSCGSNCSTTTPVVAQSTSCPVSASLPNGSFEAPAVAAGAGANVTGGDSRLIWKTTASDNKVELWANGGNSQTQNGSIPITAQSGTQWAEVNANQVGALYQDITTVPGQVLQWSVWHRARGLSSSNTTGQDVMQVQIGTTTSQTAQVPSGQSSANISDGPLAWVNYTGFYTVPAGQSTTRFQFAAISTASGQATVGNFIDNLTLGNSPCLTATTTAQNQTAGAGGLTRPGDTLQYTVTTANSGGSTSGATVITGAIPSGTSYVPGSLAIAGVPVSDQAGDDGGEVSGSTVTARVGTGATATAGGTLASGASTSITFKVKVNSTVTAGTVVANSSTVSYVWPPSTTTYTTQSSTSSSLVNTTSMTLTKSVDSTVDVNGNGRADVGDRINYSFKVTDTGSVALTGITVTDNKAGTVSCPTTSANAGAAVVCTATYTVTQADANAGGVTNTATASGTPPSGAAAITSAPSSVTTPIYVPALSVSIAASTASVSAVGQNITFTTVVTNGGNSTLTGVNVVAATTAPAGSFSSSTCSVNQPTTVAAGGSYTCTSVYPVAQADLDNGAVVGTASAVGTPPQGSAVSASSSASVSATRSPALSVTASANPTRVTAAGQTVAYSFAVTNTGNVTVSGVSISDAFTAPAGPVPSISCAATTLAPGSTTTCTSANYTVLAADITAGQIVNTASAKGTGAGGTAVTSSSSSVTVVAAPPVITFNPGPGEIGVAYSQSPTITGGDGPFSWSVTGGSLPAGIAINAATGALTGTPTASGNFSIVVSARDSKGVVATKSATFTIAALPFVSSNSPTGPQVGIAYSKTYTVSGGTGPVTWSMSAGGPSAGLPPGLTLNPSTGVLSGTPTKAGTFDFIVQAVDANNKSATRQDSLSPTAGPIVITKTASVSSTAPGGTVTYTITVANSSSSTAFSGVAFSDPLTGVLDDATYNNNVAATAGTAGYAGSTISWSGDLAASTTVRITYSVTVATPDTGDQLLANTVSSSTVGANCGGGTVDSRCSTTVTVSGLRIVTTADAATTTPGGTVHYSVVVTNTGKTAYTGAGFTQDLTDVLDDAAFNSDATATAGNVSYSSPTISWTGNLAVGASATISYSITANTPDAGNQRMVTTAVSSTAGSTCPSGSPAAGCTATVTVQTPGLTITNVAGSAPPVLLGHWTFDEGSGSTAADTGGSHPATLGSGAGWTASRQGNSALNVTGSTSSTADTGAAVLDTTASFSVSAAVKLSQAGGFQTFVSQDGNSVSGFFLELRADTGKFAFSRYATDFAGDETSASSLTAPVTGRWYVLTGVYDSTSGTLALYVDGQLQQRVTAPPAWQATGHLVVGRGEMFSRPTWWAWGAIDDVQVYRGVLYPTPATTTPGGTVPLTTVIANSGQTAYGSTTVTINLSAATDDAVYNNDAVASAGTLVYNSGAGTLVWTGSLAVGAVVTVTSSMTVRNPDPGDKTLTTVASSTAVGSSCPPGSQGSGCTASVAVRIPALTITTTADVSTTTPGSVVHYTVLVTDSGQTDYSGISFTAALADVLDDAAVGGATATTGAVSVSGTALTWTGNLAVGASVTVNYTATVNNPDAGNGSLASSITSTAVGNNCSAGDVRCTSTIAVRTPGLTITNVAAPASPVLVGHWTFDEGTGSTAADTGGSHPATLTGGAGWAAGIQGSSALATNGSGYADTGASILDTSASFSVSARVKLDNLNGFQTYVSQDGNSVSGFYLQLRADTGTFGLTMLSADSTGATTYTAVAQSAPVTGRWYLLTGVYDAAAGTMALYVDGRLQQRSAAPIGWRATGDLVIGRGKFTNPTDFFSGTVDDVQAYSGVLYPAAATTTPGATVPLTTVIANSGQTAYGSASVTIDLSAATDDAVYNNDATASAGSLAYNATAKTLTWTGTLALGAVVTVSSTMTVRQPDPGDLSIVTVATSSAPGSNCVTGSQTDSCTAAVAVLIPGLTITKTASASTVVTGGQVTYTIVAQNTGQTPYSAATFTDSLTTVLPDASYDGNATASGGTVAYSAPVLSWTGPLAIGASATISYSVTVRDPDPANKRLLNTVVSTSAGNNCPSGGTDSRCTADVTVLVPALTLVKTADQATTAPGAVVHYTVTVTNSGQTPYTGASFVDSLTGVLDDATYNGDAAATSGTAAFDSSGLGWTGDLAVGASATVSYSVTVRAADVGDDILTNAVVSSTKGSNCAAGSTDSRCTTSVPVARLTIVQGAEPATSTPGSVLSFSTTFTNTGKVPYTNITAVTPGDTISDDADPNGDQTASSGSLSFSQQGIVWSGSIPVGGSVTITGTATIKNPDTGDHVIVTSWTSAAPGNNCPVGGTDPRCSATTRVVVPALSISVASDSTQVTPGATVGYTVTISNTGETPYTGAQVQTSLADVLSDASYDNDAVSSSGGVLSYSSSTLSWTGDLAVGATVVISYSITVLNPDPGDKSLDTTVTSAVPGSSCPAQNPGAGCSNLVSVLTPALTIVKTADVTAANLGSTVHFTVTVTNSGQTPYTGATFRDDLAGVGDDATFGSDQQASSGAVTATTAAVVWTGDLAVGASATVTYSVTVNNPDTGDRSLTGTVISTTTGSNCAAGRTDTRCALVIPVLASLALSFRQTADVATTVGGGTVHFTDVVTNNSRAPLSATFSDSLAGIVDDAAYVGSTASSGTLSYSAPVLTWAGTVAAGGTVAVTYTVTANAVDTGDLLLRGQLSSSSAPGSNNCAAASTDPGCTTTVPVARLQLQQTASESSATPGSTIHLVQIYTNTGQVPYSNITVSSPRADIADDTTPTGDQQATSGTIVRTATSLDWSGDIPVGGTVTITRSSLVNNPDLGNRRITATLNSSAPGNNCPTGTTDPLCTFLVPVLLPGLTISKTSSVATAQPGDVVGYTVAISNTGQVPYSSATVTDALSGTLDDAVYNGDVSLPGVTFDGSRLSWTGDLAVGAVVSFSYSVTVKSPDPGDKLMTGAATSTAVGSSCLPGAPAVGCAPTVVVLTPGLTITKTTTVPYATLGSTVGYTILIVNSGQTSYPTAAVTDDLTDVLDDATLQGSPTLVGPGSVDVTGALLSWSGALAPGDSATITYLTQINSPSSGNRQLQDNASSTTPGSNCASGSTDARCASSVAVTNSKTLTFTKTADVLYTAAGQTVTYTVTAHNSGALPLLGIGFTDPLGDIVDDSTYNGDAAASSGSVSVSDGALNWSGSLLAGGTAAVTYSVVVNGSGNDLLTGSVSSTSVTGSDNCLSGSTDPRCTSTVPVADLQIAAANQAASTTPGSVVTLSVTFTNRGQYPYAGISISSPGAGVLDDATPRGDQSATSGTLTVSGGVLTWTGDIPVDGSVTVSGSFLVNDPPTGDGVINAPWQSAAPGNNCPAGGTDPLCTATVAVLVPGLTVTQSASSGTVQPGQSVQYAVTITDSGQTDYAATTVIDDLSGLLDDATLNTAAATQPAATAGSVSFDGSTSALTWSGSLSAGDVVTVTFSVTVRSPDPGDKQMTATLRSGAVGSSCPTDGSGTGCSSTVQVLTPGLQINTSTSVAAATLGSAVTYTVVVTNDGQTDYAAASFADDLTRTLDDATFVSVSGNASYDSATGTLRWSGALAVGDSATITYTVSVNDPASGDGTMTGVLTSADDGNNCLIGSTDPQCSPSVQVIAARTLQFAQHADVATTVAGGTVRFSDTVTNNSTQPVLGATFTDALAGVLDDAAYAASTASSGSITVADSTLTWTGDIAAGATVTVTYTVIAATADTGDLLLTGRISSPSAPGSDNCSDGSTDSLCSATVPVARLELARHTTVSTATPGTLLHLPVTFSNTGQVPYVGISVTIPRADASDDVNPVGPDVASSGILVRTATATVWTGDIPVGATVTITIDRVVKDPDTGNKVITAPLISTAPGNNCPADSPDPRCTFSIAVVVPGLSVSTTADTVVAQPGDVVHYTVLVHNTGQTDYTAATVTDDLSSLLDDAGYLGDATADTGTVSGSQSLTWTGDLPVGASATITFSVTVDAPDPGDKAMVSTVSSSDVGSTCPPGGSDPSCRSTVIVLTPALTITTAADTATTAPGSTIHFTVTATNTGQTFYPNATFAIDLGGVLDDAGYGGDAAAGPIAGNLTVSGGQLTWSGPLGPGDSTAVTFSATVNTPDTGNAMVTPVVTSGTLGSNCPTGGTDSRCSTSVPVAQLQLTNTADVSQGIPTSVVHYTGTFTNTGTVPYTDITIADGFVGALDDAVYNGDAAATSGDVIIVVGSGRLVWKGSVAVGQTVTVTGSLTINNPDRGDRVLRTKLTTGAVGANCPLVGGTDPTCATTVTVQLPVLTLTDAVDVTTTTPGGTVQHTVTIANTGPTPYTGITVSDDLTSVLNDARYNGDASTGGQGAVAFAGSTLTWTGDLTVGATVVLTFSVTVNNPDTGDRTMIDRLTSTAIGSSCPPGGTDAACSTTVTVLLPALAITISSDTSSTTPGSVVGYTVTIANTGETDYLGAVVQIDLSGVVDDVAAIGDATSTLGTVSRTGPTLTWTGDLPTSAVAVVSYQATVADPDNGDHNLLTSVSSAEAGGTCPPAAPCTDAVPVLVPGLSVSTSTSVASATPGDLVSFTVTVRNTGQTDYPAASFTASLAGVADDATIDPTVTATVGVATYSAPDLAWSGALPVGASAQITFSARVSDPDTGDRELTAVVVAPAAGSNCRAGSTDLSCSFAMQVKIPVLTITKTALSGSTTTPGSVVTYRISISNTGEAGYADATVSDSLQGVLADATYNADAAVDGGGSVHYADSVLQWTGGLDVGSSATVTYSITVLDPDPGSKTITNTVFSTAPGSTCPPGGGQVGCSAVVRVLVPSLTITQQADRTTVVAGDQVHYTVTLTNTGETAYTAAAVHTALAGVIDDATYDANAAVVPSSSGTVGYDSTTSDLLYTGDIGVGAAVTISYSVTTRFPATGDHTLTSAVTFTGPGSSCQDGTEPDCHTSVELLVPALSIVKAVDTGAAVAGGSLDYTITATNTGEAPYTDASITDSLAGLAAHATYAGDALATVGTVDYAAGTLTWQGPLATGDSVVITYSVQLDVDIDDGTVLVNTAQSTDVGSTCPPAGGAATCSTSTPIAARSISLSVLTPSFTLTGAPGATVEADGAVIASVTTNSTTGYTVTVEPDSAALTAATPGNTASIPIDALGVRETGSGLYQQLLTGTPRTVHESSGPSAPGGDAISNDYQLQVPLVAPDVYSGTIDYIASTQ